MWLKDGDCDTQVQALKISDAEGKRAIDRHGRCGGGRPSPLPTRRKYLAHLDLDRQEKRFRRCDAAFFDIEVRD